MLDDLFFLFQIHFIFSLGFCNSVISHLRRTAETFSLQDFLPKLRLQNLVYEIQPVLGRYNGSMKVLQQQV